MIQTFCDRCGRVMMTPTEMTPMSIMPRYSIVHNGAGIMSPAIKIDLCHFCEDDFDKWMRFDKTKDVQENSCDNCTHYEKDIDEHPCKDCKNLDFWEAKE